MTLKNKIALTFTLITSIILIGICFVIYWLSDQYTRNEFFLRMHDRAEVAAAFQLDEDELSPRLYSEISRKHLQSLISEEEYLIPLNGALRLRPLPDFLDSAFIARIQEEEFATKIVGNLSIAGIRYEDNQGTFAVVITAEDKFGLRKLNNLRRILIGIVLSYLLLVFFIGRWYANQVLAPLIAIINQMRTINSTNLHQRIPEEDDRRDEISQLAHTFNNLLNRIETSIETQRNFVNNASHELKNPLTAILGEIEIILKHDRSKEEYRNALVQVGEEAERLKNLTLRLLKLAQTSFSENGNKDSIIRLDELLIEVVEELNKVTATGRVKLSFGDMPEETQELETSADLNLLRIAFANVIENAVKFSEGQTVLVSFGYADQQFKIKVQDRGIGIPKQDTEKIFAPFYRAGNALKFQGFGVGLPLVKKIVDIHEGSIQVESEPGKGTIVTLILPRRRS